MAKKKHQPESAAQTLSEIETRGDRLAEWISDNPVLILGTALGLLVLVGAISLVNESRESTHEDAAADLATVQADFRQAMGAPAGAVDVPEPANPETARSVRDEYIEKYIKVAATHRGTSSATLALLEAGTLQQQRGLGDAAVGTLEDALAQADPADPLRPFVQRRLASVHESEGRYEAAAEAFLASGNTPGFALRNDSLADAARCFAEAGRSDRALAVYSELQDAAADYQLPPYLVAKLEELKGDSAQ